MFTAIKTICVLFLVFVSGCPCYRSGDVDRDRQEVKRGRYGDPLRNLPAWELDMIEQGRSSKEIDAEFEKRSRQRESYDEWYRRVGPIIPAGD